MFPSPANGRLREQPAVVAGEGRVRARHQTGFTLFEILIALSLISILSLCAFPTLQNLFSISNNTLCKDKLLEAIHFAQQEALTRDTPIALSTTENQDILVFTDDNNDGIIHHKQQLLSTTQLGKQSGELHLRSYPYYRHYLQFLPRGQVSSDNGTFWYCPTGKTTPAWAIIVNKAARPRVVYAEKDEKVRDSHGKELSC